MHKHTNREVEAWTQYFRPTRLSLDRNNFRGTRQLRGQAAGGAHSAHLWGAHHLWEGRPWAAHLSEVHM